MGCVLEPEYQEQRSSLTTGRMFNIMSNMSRKVSAREFLHGFAKLEKELRPGESVTVTRRGKEVGKFVKKDDRAKIQMPDFEKHASLPGIGARVGDELFARLMSDEAVC
jgi:hypothetical protein